MYWGVGPRGAELEKFVEELEQGGAEFEERLAELGHVALAMRNVEELELVS